MAHKSTQSLGSDCSTLKTNQTLKSFYVNAAQVMPLPLLHSVLYSFCVFISLALALLQNVYAFKCQKSITDKRPQLLCIKIYCIKIFHNWGLGSNHSHQASRLNNIKINIMFRKLPQVRNKWILHHLKILHLTGLPVKFSSYLCLVSVMCWCCPICSFWSSH